MATISCPECNNPREVSEKYAKSANAKRMCKSCAMRKKWQDEAYKDKISKSVSSNTSKMWKSKKYREAVTESNSKTWSARTDELSRRSADLWQNEEYKSKISKSLSEYCINNNIKPEFSPSEAARIGWKDPEFRKNIRQKMKEKWKSQEYRDNMRQKMVALYSDPEHLKKMSEISLALWKDDDYINKQGEGRAKAFPDGFISKPEVVLIGILDDLKIKHEKVIVGPYEIDRYLPDYNIAIEVQGDYWHNLPNIIRRDKAKATYIAKYRPDFTLKYIWEHEFMVMDRVSELIKYWCGVEFDKIDFNFRDIEIKEIDRGLAEMFISKYHYAGRLGNTEYVYGAFHGDILAAVGVFGGITRNESATRLGLTSKDMLELTRFAIHPQYHKKNFGSYLLSKVVKLLDPSIKCLIAFSDLSHNHHGTIYKAAGWEYDGAVPASYYYRDKDGWVMHKKTLYNHALKLKMKESEFAIKYRYNKIKDKGKSRYVMWRNK